MDRITDEVELARLSHIFNPNGEAVGPFTGRCTYCGSRDLWTADNMLDYGCSRCGACFRAGDLAPRVIYTTTGEDHGLAW